MTRNRSLKSGIRKGLKWGWLSAVRPFKQMRYGRILRRPNGGLSLHIGCGGRRLDGFINIDMNEGVCVDYKMNASRLPCSDGSVSRIETYHVIEHIPHPYVAGALREWFRVLKQGGVLVIECPNFDEAVRGYLDGDETMLLSIFGRQRYHGDAHLFGYNAMRLTRLLKEAGFSAVKVCEPTDYHAEQEPCMRLEASK